MSNNKKNDMMKKMDTFKKFEIDMDELESVNSIIITYDDGSVLVFGREKLVSVEKLK